MNSTNGLPDSWTVPVGAHVHANWGFSAEGRYTITFQVDATLANGAPVSSGPVEYVFHVDKLAHDVDLTIEGMAASYAPGDTVTLAAVQHPPTELDHYHWFVKPASGEDYIIVPSEVDATYSFAAAAELDGAQYIARLYDDDHDVVAESPPVTLHVEGSEPVGPSQTITVTLDESQGALVISVDPNDREVLMAPFQLGTAADRWVSSGELRPVTVTDTRAGAPGWTASGQVGDFVSDDRTFDGKYLGWATVVQAGGALGAVAGPDVAIGFASDDGLKSSRVLGSAAAGGGFGTSVLGAGLSLEVPTSIQPGTYTATMTFTVI